MYLRIALLLALTLSLGSAAAFAQSSDSGSSSSDSGSSTTTAAPSSPPANLPPDLPAGETVTTGAYGQPLLPEGNPLTGLFTPQPQYQTPQTKMNDSPTPAGETNPIGKLFTYQNPNPEAPPAGTNNMLQGAFTAQPQFATPQSQVNPEPQAKFALPGYGQARFDEMAKFGVPFKVPGTDIGSPGAPPTGPGTGGVQVGVQPSASGRAAGADKDNDNLAARDKAAGGDKEPSKDKDRKDASKVAATDGDKMGDSAAKDKDAAGAKDKTADAAKNNDGAAAKDKTADKDKDKDKEKDKETAKEDEKPKNLGPYNPLKDAIFFLNNGQYKEAVGIISVVLAKNPASAEAHYIAAVCFVGLRDFNMAAEEYRLVLRLVPTTTLAQMSIEGLKKIRMPVTMSSVLPGKLPPLRGH